MDRLWAPWRLKYVLNAQSDGEGCIFCTKPAQEKDAENFILHRAKHCFVMLNRFPYNNGHLLVIPYKHTPSLDRLLPEEKLDLMQVVDLSVTHLKTALNAEGFNVGMNLGRTGGAGIDQHIHMHIVPRWNGDTNFMPVLGEVKVISESLEECYQRLAGVFHGT